MNTTRKLLLSDIERDHDRYIPEDPWKVRGLAADIAENGLLTSIQVRETTRLRKRRDVRCWLIVDGHYRTAACRSLGYTEITAEVIPFVPLRIPSEEEALQYRRDLAATSATDLMHQALHSTGCFPAALSRAIKERAWEEFRLASGRTCRYPTMSAWMAVPAPIGLGATREQIRQVIVALEGNPKALAEFEAELAREVKQ